MIDQTITDGLTDDVHTLSRYHEFNDRFSLTQATSLMNDSFISDGLIMGYRKQYRYYSRQVSRFPNQHQLHQKRLLFASQFVEYEPIQGALADYFYACWYDLPIIGAELLTKLRHKLPSRVYDTFLRALKRGNVCHERISVLATSWSVLAIPSMEIADNFLRTSRDHSGFMVTDIMHKLLAAKQSQDESTIHEVENAFFEHCLVCQDRMAFMRVWFKLSNHNWHFHQHWVNCREQLESRPKNNQPES